MAELFEKFFEVGWRDLDPLGHVANMVYMEYAIDTRIAFFASTGFGPNEFLKAGIGPVVKRDITEYFREMNALDRFKVTMENSGESEDGSRFRVVNNIYKDDGTHTARITSIGGWLDLKARKLIAPPPPIRDAWASLIKTDDYEVLPSSVKR